MVSGTTLITDLVTTAISIPLYALILWVATRILKTKDKSYKSAIFVAAIVGMVGFIGSSVISFLSPSTKLGPVQLSSGLLASGGIPGIMLFIIVNIAFSMWLIKYRYKLSLGMAALVWLIPGLLAQIVARETPQLMRLLVIGIPGIMLFIVLNIAFSMWFIRYRHKLAPGRAASVWLIWVIGSIIVALVFELFFFGAG